MYDEPSPRQKNKKIVQENPTSPQFKDNVQTRSSAHKVKCDLVQEQEDPNPGCTQDLGDDYDYFLPPSPSIGKKRV